MYSARARRQLPAASSQGTPAGTLSWGELLFIGIGGIIGAGFFLGSGLPIHMAGPSVVLAFIVGGLVTAQVTGALTSISFSHPVQGSFKVFADMYIGKYAGFLQGWVYYLTSILTISSEAVAMAVFSKSWLPHVPQVVLVSVYCIAIIALNAFGVKSFGTVESIMSAVKIAALVGFVLYLSLHLFANAGSPGITSPSTAATKIPALFTGNWFPHGITGFLQSMLVVIFAYAGIGVFATAVSDMRHPSEIDKAGWGTVSILTVLYTLSIVVLLLVHPWSLYNTSVSPFVLAWRLVGLNFLSELFNAVIFVASFSVMAGAVFSAGQILATLGESGEAPVFVTKKDSRGVAMGALLFTTGGIAIAIIASYLLPSNVYSFLVSASSFFTFLNWFLILWTFLSWRVKTTDDDKFLSSLSFGQPVSTVLTMVVFLLLAGYALTQHDQRIGFYFCIAICFILSLFYLWVKRKRTRGVKELRRNEE